MTPSKEMFLGIGVIPKIMKYVELRYVSIKTISETCSIWVTACV